MVRHGRILWGFCCLLAGCTTTAYVPPPPVVLPAGLPAVSACQQEETVSNEPIGFPELLQIALARNPQLRIAREQAEAARGRMIQAGLYFNPTLGWQASDLGLRPNEAGKEGPIVSQVFVTANKLEIAQTAARHGVAAADWQAFTRWFDVVGLLRSAFYTALAARREVAVNEELVRIARGGLDAAEKLLKAGTTGKPDVLRAKVEREQFRNRLDVARQAEAASLRLLATAAGLTRWPGRPLAGNLDETVPEYDFAALQAQVLEQSSEVQAALAAVAEAGLLLRRAEVEVVPNVQVSLQPYYAFVEQRAGGQLSVSAPIPVFNRNQGNIRAARADVARAQANVQATELRLTERLATAYQRYRASRQQVDNFRKRILPDARESLKLVLLGYERGDPRYDYTALLQAQNILAQARLSLVQARAELQRAVSELEALWQRDLGAFFLDGACNE